MYSDYYGPGTSSMFSLLNRYIDIVAANQAYFTYATHPDDDSEPDSAAFIRFFGTSFTPSPIDIEALDYLVGTVGLSKRDIRLAGWASLRTGNGSNVLVAPARVAGKVLAVRAISVRSPSGVLMDVQPVSTFTLDPSDRIVESDPEETLEVDDVPVPFRPRLFDEQVTWVSHDPVDALVLKSLGLNATSLANPFATLGSKEGLWQLHDIGAMSHRKFRRGTLVIIDPNAHRTVEQEALLTGQFREVLVAGERYTGPNLWGIVRAGRRSNMFHPDPQEALLGGVRRYAETSLRTSPLALPPRTDGSAWEGTRQPFAFVPVSELARKSGSELRWLVEGFIAPGAIIQFLGGSKAGKSTLLLSMLAEVSRGGTFLGQACPKSPVLYVTEQGKMSFAKSLARSLPVGTTADDLPDLRALTAEMLYGRSWADVLALVRTTSKRVGAQVVVFDTLSEAADVGGDAENSAGASRVLYRTLRGLLNDGMAVVAVRHTRKNERGGIAESGLGSVANSGAADHLVRVREVKADSTIRRIDTKGRISDAEDFYLDLTPSGWVRTGRAPSEAKREARGSGLWRLVGETIQKAGVDGLQRKALMEKLRAHASAASQPVPSRGAIDRALTSLAADGYVSEERAPGKGGPKLFRFISTPTPSGW